MNTEILFGLFFSFLEKLSFLIFPLALFKYAIRARIIAILLICLILTIATHFIRQYEAINVPYSVFIGMMISYVLTVVVLKIKPFPAITVISVGYITNSTIQVVILIMLIVTTNQSLTQITNHFNHQILIYAITFLMMMAASYFTKKFEWQVSLEQAENTRLSRQINIFVSLFSLVGLIMVIQTITVFFSLNTHILQSIPLILGTFGLFLILFLIIRNIILSQKHAKIEEDKHYLETITTYSSEIKHSIREYKAHLKVLQRLAHYQDPTLYKQYLSDLLTEKEFLMETIEISEPMLSSFLQKEWHVCRVAGVHLQVTSYGYYLPPAFISGYNLNRILARIIDGFITDFKKGEKLGSIHFCVDATHSEHVKFVLQANVPHSIKPDILEFIRIYNGKADVHKEDEQTILTFYFSRY